MLIKHIQEDVIVCARKRERACSGPCISPHTKVGSASFVNWKDLFE